MQSPESKQFDYANERFADIQMLRYRLNGFENLTLRQKLYVYYLSEATLAGRDITFDQYGQYNLRIRKTLEAVVATHRCLIGHDSEMDAIYVYLKRVWFSNGIHHHYGCEKFEPDFSEDSFRRLVNNTPSQLLPLGEGEEVDELLSEICPIIFDPQVCPKRVNQAEGDDLVRSSACNFYEGISQQEAERFYAEMKSAHPGDGASWGLNSRLVKKNGRLVEETWTAQSLYGEPIKHIVTWLKKAAGVAENEQQKNIISLLVKYYQKGDLHDFDQYSIEWLKETEGMVDFINGFIEVYGDPLGLKGTWEGIVHYKDTEATRRTRLISDNAQWFEDHSPVDPRFRKKVVKGVVAHVVCAAMLGGEEYPSSAIGINLPNADWIRAAHGSKSVTIGNLTEAYNKAAHGNGFREEFIDDQEVLSLKEKYDDMCDDLHTDLHECLGHGSGQLLPDTDPDALKAYGSTIEEARADLFGLYYIADEKLVQLGLLPDGEAYKAQYFSYLLNGLLTQLTRIREGHQIEEAHMRNRALIARWVMSHSEGNVSLCRKEDKTFLHIHDFAALRALFARLLAEVQRIKSEGDFEAARHLVEDYGVKVDPQLHAEVLERYRRLNLAPYKGFINPRLSPVYSPEGEIVDVRVDYTESYDHQMMRYSQQYGFL